MTTAGYRGIEKTVLVISFSYLIPERVLDLAANPACCLKCSQS